MTVLLCCCLIFTGCMSQNTLNFVPPF